MFYDILQTGPCRRFHYIIWLVAVKRGRGEGVSDSFDIMWYKCLFIFTKYAYIGVNVSLLSGTWTFTFQTTLYLQAYPFRQVFTFEVGSTLNSLLTVTNPWNGRQLQPISNLSQRFMLVKIMTSSKDLVWGQSQKTNNIDMTTAGLSKYYAIVFIYIHNSISVEKMEFR